jgi:hypothetical protein
MFRPLIRWPLCIGHSVSVKVRGLRWSFRLSGSNQTQSPSFRYKHSPPELWRPDIGFDQVKVVLDGGQYTIHCRCAFGLNRTPQQGLSDPVSCARQCTKAAGSKVLQSNMSEECALLFNDLLAESKPRILRQWCEAGRLRETNMSRR